MRRDGDAWAAVVDLDLKVSGGVLDVLRFDLPSQSNAPILADPAIPQEFVESTGEERRQLVLRPAEPIAGAQHIRLTVPVPASGGQRVRVPDVRPVNLGQLHRFVRLPTNFNEQQLAWNPRGLKFEPLPGGFAMTSPTTEIYRIGNVIGESFAASLKSIEKGTAGPRVRLANIRIVSPDGNAGYGTAAFDLDPAGAATCLLDMPPEFRLVHVQLNDGPAIIRQVAPNQWSAALGVAKLPQRMEIVFQVDRASDGAASGPAFRAPSLIGFSVEQTLWSIESPQPVELASDQSGTKRVSSLESRLVELQAAAAMLETTASLLPNDSEQQISLFVTLVARRAMLVRSEIDRERKRFHAADENPSFDAALRAIDAARASLSRKLDLQKLFGDLSSQLHIARGPSEIIRLAGGDDDATTTFASTDQSGSLALAPMARPNDGFASRLPTALAAALIVVGLFWLAGREEFAEAAVRWPECLVVVAGLCWWLWLAPSYIGCGIIVASIAAGFWRRRVRTRLTDLSSPRSPRGLSSAATSLTPNSQWGQTPDRPAALD